MPFNASRTAALSRSRARAEIPDASLLQVHYELSMVGQRTSFFYDGTQLPPKPSKSRGASMAGSTAGVSVASSRMSWASSARASSTVGSARVGMLGQEVEEVDEPINIWWALEPAETRTRKSVFILSVMIRYMLSAFVCFSPRQTAST